MMNRRIVITGMASLAFATSAFADDWKAKYPEITFGVIPAENGSGVTERFGPFVAYLSKQLGVKVTLRVANDYAAVIEGQRAGNIQIGYYGPASFARARLTGVKTDAFVIDVNADGSKGYYSVFYVLAKSPYQKVEDLKGKTIGFVDPNSTSGYNAPRFYLHKMGIDVDAFFSKSIITGSHENGVIALDKGTVDCAADWWNSDNDSNLTRMVKKGMVKKEDFRVIFKSGLLAGSPYAYLIDLPSDLKQSIAKAFTDAPTKDKAAFSKLSDGKDKEFVPVTHKDYENTVDMIQFVNDMRKKRS
ncbi:MAG TPA: phosphonate ABC transporter substrate-binding protein [Bradyrhizobium sp.]